KSRSRIKNFRPICMTGMQSAPMILRKWRMENPACSAAWEISRKVLVRGDLVFNRTVVFMIVLTPATTIVRVYGTPVNRVFSSVGRGSYLRVFRGLHKNSGNARDPDRS